MKKQLMLAACLTALCTNAQVTNGLVAKYSFNTGNANDEVGTNHGTVNGAVLTADRFGNPNKAYKFTSGESITLPNAPALKSATMTVSMWVKIDGYNPGANPQNYIYTLINSNVNAYFATFGLTISSSDGKYFSVAQNNPSQSTYGSSTASNTAAWQHYVLAMDNDSLKMYIDGLKQWSYYKGFTSTFTSDLIYIGVSGNTTYNGNLNGKVDDIKVYNRVLTLAEVNALYNESNPATVDIKDNKAGFEKIQVYPNPCNNTIQLGKKCDVEVLDLTGKVLYSQNNTNQLNLSDFEPGLYILSLGSGAIHQITKIVKQ